MCIRDSSPSASSPPIVSTATTAPTAYGPSGAVGGYRRAPGVQTPGARSAPRRLENSSALRGIL
eukprot:10365429-Alexandrium_andersonii.AAC.1